MSRAVPMEVEVVDAIAACLKKDDVVGGYVNGNVGRIGSLEHLPKYIEIGHTYEAPAAGSSSAAHLVTNHVWSKSGTAQEIHDIMNAAERAMANEAELPSFRREFIQVRFDDRYASHHGLLRVCFKGNARGKQASRVAP